VSERRAIEEIRRDIESERAQLEDALTSLRADVEAKRRPAARALGALSAALTAVLVLRVVRRARRR
jgi:hypothetical protein